MRNLRLIGALAVLLLLPLPILADSLQMKYEKEAAKTATAAALDAVLDAAISEGLSIPSGGDISTYLSEFHEAYAKFPAAWAQYTQDLGRDKSNAGKWRDRLLDEIKRPLSDAHMSLARHYLQSKRTPLGYGLDIAAVFRQDLDRAIVLKNAAALHAFFFRYLAKADLDADAKNPSLPLDLLVAMLKETDGYSVSDFKDIFYYQAPEASTDYIDAEIFSLYQTLKDQRALADPVSRLLKEAASPGDATLPERHQRVKRILGILAFGSESAGKDFEPPLPPAFKEVQQAASRWALKQGLMRTLLFGEQLANEYALGLKSAECMGRLRAFQKQLQSK
jgi:hypothetical protein